MVQGLQMDELLAQLDKLTLNGKSSNGQYDVLREVIGELGKKSDYIDNMTTNFVNQSSTYSKYISPD
jgi:hypothetical protein